MGLGTGFGDECCPRRIAEYNPGERCGSHNRPRRTERTSANWAARESFKDAILTINAWVGPARNITATDASSCRRLRGGDRSVRSAPPLDSRAHYGWSPDQAAHEAIGVVVSAQFSRSRRRRNAEATWPREHARAVRCASCGTRDRIVSGGATAGRAQQSVRQHILLRDAKEAGRGYVGLGQKISRRERSVMT